MEWIFRTALPSEHGDADRILRAAFTPYIRRLGREITADYYKWLAASIERGDVFVADAAGRIVGVAATERRDNGLYLDRLAVDPATQGTGLGSWLLVRLEEIARSRGDRTMSLETAEMMGPPHPALSPPRLRDRPSRPAGSRQGFAHARPHGEAAVTRRNDR